MGTFLFDKIVFGPVESRRLGVSLGINLLPNDCKLCNFNCIYCECGWTPESLKQKEPFHPRGLVKQKLLEKLQEMKANGKNLSVITFAGNGEPTLHPDFEKIIDDTIALRDIFYPQSRIAVLSNASLIRKESVFRALNRIEDNILKLDGGFEHTILTLNQPVGYFNLEKTIELLLKFEGNLIIQTLFIRGKYNGKAIDNTTGAELEAWIQHLERIKPRKVMIYTIARDTPTQCLEKVSVAELSQIAEKVKKIGLAVQISG